MFNHLNLKTGRIKDVPLLKTAVNFFSSFEVGMSGNRIAYQQLKDSQHLFFSYADIKAFLTNLISEDVNL